MPAEHPNLGATAPTLLVDPPATWTAELAHGLSVARAWCSAASAAALAARPVVGLDLLPVEAARLEPGWPLHVLGDLLAPSLGGPTIVWGAGLVLWEATARGDVEGWGAALEAALAELRGCAAALDGRGTTPSAPRSAPPRRPTGARALPCLLVLLPAVPAGQGGSGAETMGQSAVAGALTSAAQRLALDVAASVALRCVAIPSAPRSPTAGPACVGAGGGATAPLVVDALRRLLAAPDFLTGVLVPVDGGHHLVG